MLVGGPLGLVGLAGELVELRDGGLGGAVGLLDPRLDREELPQPGGAVVAQLLHGRGLLQQLGGALRVEHQLEVAVAVVGAHVGLAAELGDVLLGPGDVGLRGGELRSGALGLRLALGELGAGDQGGVGGSLGLDGHPLQLLLGGLHLRLDLLDLLGERGLLGGGGSGSGAGDDGGAGEEPGDRGGDDDGPATGAQAATGGRGATDHGVLAVQGRQGDCSPILATAYRVS